MTVKSQIPNPKLQRNPKLQAPEDRSADWDLEIGVSASRRLSELGFGIWNLELSYDR
jgi:hypothetical protein